MEKLEQNTKADHRHGVPPQWADHSPPPGHSYENQYSRFSSLVGIDSCLPLSLSALKKVERKNHLYGIANNEGSVLYSVTIKNTLLDLAPVLGSFRYISYFPGLA